MVAVVFGNGVDATNTNNSSFYVGGTGLLTPTSASNVTVVTSGTQGTTGTNPNRDFVIGAIHASKESKTYVFNGGIDMVKAYQGALSESELDALYTNGMLIPEPTSSAFSFGGLAMACAVLWRKRQTA